MEQLRVERSMDGQHADHSPDADEGELVSSLEYALLCGARQHLQS